MILVNVNSLDSNSCELTIKGHSGKAEYGKDLVCAAVSACSVGAINALENPQNFNLIVEEGNVQIRAITTITKHDQIVLETLVTQLKTIEETDPKYVKVVEKGN